MASSAVSPALSPATEPARSSAVPQLDRKQYVAMLWWPAVLPGSVEVLLLAVRADGVQDGSRARASVEARSRAGD